MKTILSQYEKSDNVIRPAVYSKTEIVTKQVSNLAKQARTVARPRVTSVSKLESSYDLDQYDTYLS
jgi:hypothetical protein